MSYDRELLENPPYYNIVESIESYGFDLSSFMEDGFRQFVHHTYLADFIEFRKAYLIRDYLKLRFFAHKFKGSFAYIETLCLKMQKIIETGSIDVEDIYVDIVKRMNVFLIKLIDLAKKLKNPIDKELLNLFRKTNDECDIFEDISVRQKLSGEQITSSDIINDQFNKDDNFKAQVGLGNFYQGNEPNTNLCCNCSIKNCNIL